MGSVVVEDVGGNAPLWGVVWAVFAAVAGFGLAVAATTLWRRAEAEYESEFSVGYNALAAVVDRS